MRLLEYTISELLLEMPERVIVFELFGIDYACGHQTLAEACQKRKVNPDMLLRALVSQVVEQSELVESRRPDKTRT